MLGDRDERMKDRLDKLIENGAEIVIGLEATGCMSGLPLCDVERFLADPVEYLAYRCGVSKRQYLDFQARGENDQEIKCAGTTVKNRPCKNPVLRGQWFGVRQWVEAVNRGEKCNAHGGGTAR